MDIFMKMAGEKGSMLRVSASCRGRVNLGCDRLQEHGVELRAMSRSADAAPAPLRFTSGG